MLEFVLIAAAIFTVIAFIKKSKYLFLKSIPYIIYIHLFLLFFERESLQLRIILFAVLLIFSVIIILYQEKNKEYENSNIQNIKGGTK